MTPASPPRLARRLLRWRLSGALGDAVEGDLAERYQRDRETRGRWAARLRYWHDVLSPSLGEVGRQALRIDPAPGAPVRSTHRKSIMNGLLRDLRLALRVLRKSPAFTLIAIVSLGLGIGPTTAVFSLVDAVLFRDRGAHAPERLMDIYNLNQESQSWYYSSHGVVERLRDEGADVLDGVAAWVSMQAAVDDEGTPRPVYYELVTGNYFEVLGVSPAVGRFFAPEEDLTPGTHPVVVLSHDYWVSNLDADPAAVGRSLHVNGRPYTIIGVAPEGLGGKHVPGAKLDLWLPYSMYPHLAPGQENNGNLGITARVRDGIDVATARSAVEAIGARISADRQAQGSRNEFVLGAFPWSEIYLHPDMDGPILAISGLLLVVVTLVLVVACVNLAGFLLARGMDRRREVGIRLALGSGRRHIVRQLLIESLLLGLAGGALGLLLGLWTARALASIDIPLGIELDLGIGLDPGVLAVTLGVSLLAGLLFGLAPALQASRTPVGSVLREEGNAVAGGGRRLDLRGALVTGQLALSVVLLVGAGLFVRSLSEAGRTDPGFDTGPAAILEVSGAGAGYTESAAFLPVMDDALARIEALPEVRSAALVTRLPLDLGNWVAFYDVPGVDPPAGRDNHRIEYAAVSPEYPTVMGIELLEGRAFTDADRAGEPAVALVSSALARQFWPGESAVGRTLLPSSDPGNPVTVIGVVDDVKIWSLQEPPRPYMYRPYAQAPSTFVNVVVRGSAAPAVLARRSIEAIQAADPDLFASRVKDMQDHLGYTFFLPRMGATLVGAVALLALVLSAIGLWGLVSYSVARRTREMGIRISLGAGVGSVIALVVRRGLVLAAVGASIGLLASLLVGRLLEPYLIGVGSADPVTLIGVPLVLMVVVALAALLPARRAGRVDPVQALRTD